MTLARLKWLAIAAPISVLAAMWVLVHTVLPDLHDHPLLLLTTTVVLVAAFATGVFWIVGRLEQRIVDQNDELEHRARELEAVLTVGRAASSSLELDELLDAAIDAIRRVTRADAVEVWLRSASGELALTRQRGAALAAERTLLAEGEDLPGEVARTARPVVLHDLQSESRFVRPGVVALGFKTFCGLPLQHRGQIVGVLGVASKKAGTLSDEQELRLLTGIGESVALAIANARLHERVLDTAVVEERMRIARELHDGLAQVLGYINAQTIAVKRLLAAGDMEAARDELDSMEHAAQDVYADVREAILGFRQSLPRQGLVPALRSYLDEYATMAGVRLTLEIEEEVEQIVLQPEVEIQLVRIVQEALANVRKHAHAAQGTVRLALEDDVLVVEVVDDGRGLDEQAAERTGWPRFGLQTMRERAQAVGGRFVVSSAPGEGTRVTVTLPVSGSPEVAHAARTG